MSSDTGELYLGFDLSTQSLKCLVLDRDLSVVHQESVHYCTELAHYQTTNGFHKSDTKVTSPVLMWVEALDIILTRLSDTVNLANVKGIGGCGQQHGTVYCKEGFETVLRNLDPNQPFLPQLQDTFSVKDSPIWMDGSTTDYCQKLEAKMGGPDELCQRTGSRAHTRFSVNQIHKFLCEEREKYISTERVLLVSNFLCSLLSGKYRDIDYSDGSGMNLLNIQNKGWIQEIGTMYGGVNVCEKLGDPSHLRSSVPVSSYLAKRYKMGISHDCKVSLFTGDNPATLLGMYLSNNDIILSLGTSDVLIGVSDDVTTSRDIHVFCSPMHTDDHMFIMCYKNASLVREELKDLYCNGSWDELNKMLDSTEINTELVAWHLPQHEIIPQGLHGTHNNTETPLFDYPPGTIVRSVIEGQFLSKKNHLLKAGVTQSTDSSKIIVVGGGSVNDTLLQIISDVFGVPVYRSDGADMAALGGAYLGYLAVNSKQVLEKRLGDKQQIKLVCAPNVDNVKKYKDMLIKYQDMEDRVVFNELCYNANIIVTSQ